MTQAKLAVPAIKYCTWPARLTHAAKVEPCGAQLVRGECRSREFHMLPFVTGFCNSGWHEGLKINKPTCKYYMSCPCKCHSDIWYMFALAERERTLQDNSTYRVVNTFVMPSFEERVHERATSSRSNTDAPIRLESPAPGIVPVAMVAVYAPTPSGRAARGELEMWVKEAVDVWVLDPMAHHCTPQWISERIAVQHGLGRPPSVGAVDAVLKRWQAIGFAVIEKQPNRFVRYSEEGVKFGLEFLKAKAKMK